MPLMCPRCYTVVPAGMRECPACGWVVPWTSRLARPSGRGLIAIAIVIGIGAFWLFAGVGRAGAYIDAIVDALRHR
ncbi:MAG: hypothetical protein U0166_04150 [Acidobacteriota bacterium]